MKYLKLHVYKHIKKSEREELFLQFTTFMTKQQNAQNYLYLTKQAQSVTSSFTFVFLFGPGTMCHPPNLMPIHGEWGVRRDDGT